MLGFLIRTIKDPYWHGHVSLAQQSINIGQHSILENASPYRVLFGRELNKGLDDIGIPDNIVHDITTEEELNT